jgi:NADPH-dependent 2,4-dienoyl-CoA reductase/sulfur reductase-like enzyme
MNFERVRDRVVSLSPPDRVLELNKSGKLKYDKLLIASGSLAIPAPWPGGELDGVGQFVTWGNLEWLRKKTPTAKRAVVVGGGLIGIETVEVLLKAGIRTSFLIREGTFWPIALNREESDLIVERMRHHGCDVHLSNEVAEILGKDGSVSGVRTRSGDVFECDLVMVTIGVAPQTLPFKGSGLQFDERGGIVVDEYLQTGVADIWAAGDCSSVVWFNNVRRPEQLWYTSRDQGRIAGRNMVGDRRVYKRGTFYNSAKFFDIEYTTAGLVNFNVDGEANWYHEEVGGRFTQRIVHLPDQTVIGFNMLGRRWDHRILVRWIEERRQVPWVLDHLDEARFDEEFMPGLEISEPLSQGRA